MNKKNILIIYWHGRIFPLKDTIEKHLYSWKSYSKHNVIYINIRFGFPRALIKKIRIDVVIFHNLFIDRRWFPKHFQKYLEKCEYLKKLKCLKIALPQDEFFNTKILNDFINDFGIIYVLTLANKDSIKKIYNKIDSGKVKFKQVLPGYIDDKTIENINNLKIKNIPRKIDIGYRAFKNTYNLGEKGLQKIKIAEIIEKEAKLIGLKTDIAVYKSLRNFIRGEKWFEFLLSCKATIGVEGGASVLDRDGKISEKVKEYQADNPDSSFDDVKRNCFPQEDNKLNYSCISPRHLEACITETCQLLLEGKYNNVLKPWIHYIPIKEDYSNLHEVLNLLKNDKYVNEIKKNAYRDIVQSGKYTYKNFIDEVEEEVIDKYVINNGFNYSKQNNFILRILNIVEQTNWLVTKIESRIIELIPKKIVTKIRNFYGKIIER